MTRTTPAGMRPLLLAAVALLLLTCTAAAWAIPCVHPASPRAATAFDAHTADGCGSPATSAASCGAGRMPGPAAQAVVWPGGLNSRAALLLFSTAAVAAAIGLVSSAGRRL
ncbi:hypothetical protein [Streptomyces lavendulae]|uniref:hypothetical protein n=1 Tax=Streptomyces lavendulae TaxID=1914 RepID=UPI0033E65A58